MVRTSVSPLVPDGACLGSYLEDIKRLPMLTRSEEFIVTKRCCEQRVRDAGHQLVTSQILRGAPRKSCNALNIVMQGLVHRDSALGPPKALLAPHKSLWFDRVD